MQKRIIQKPDKQEKIGRDEKGRFKPGYSGNPQGRPKGISITEMIKRKLEEVPPGEKRTYLEALILKILKKAIIDEDSQMIKNIWNYVDGMPKEKIEMESGELPFKVIIEKGDPRKE